MGDNSTQNRGANRRTFLKATTGTFAGGLAVTRWDVARAQERQEFRFGGEVAGWMGRAPERIEGQTNPTLELQVGQEYAFTWENIDGLSHNVAILDSEGNVLTSTDIVSEQGATQTSTFTASAEMAEYVCQVHPASMRGQIRTGGEQAETTQAEQPERFVPLGASVSVEQIASGFVSPVGLEVAPEATDRRFVLDQVGQIYVHGPDGLESDPFLDIADRMVDVGGRSGSDFDERGLLGLAFHPDFEQNRRLFVRYSAPLGDPPYASSVDWGERPAGFDHLEVLSEFRASEDLSAVNPDPERRILEMPSPQFNHNAGAIAFGPDGYLYVPTGDGGGADDVGLGHVEDWYDANAGGNGQDVTENLMGSVLRIDVDDQQDGLPYAIPEDNPLVGQEGLDEQFAWGFRNPWRASFNDGELFAASNGQNLFEQVEIVEKGGNYGWNVKEATHCFSTANPNQPPEQCPSGTPPDVRGGEQFTEPIIEYPHTYEGRGVGVSVIGGYVYAGDAIPEIRGKYVFGDYSRTGADPAGRIFAATPAEGEGLWSLEELRVANREGGTLGKFILSFGRGRDGELYVLGNDTGVIRGETGAVFRIGPP